MINPKNSENALKLIQTELETKHVISEKADMTEVDIKNKLTVGGSEEYGSFAIGGAARDFDNPNRSSKGNFDIYMDMSIVLNDCTITDSGTALSVTAGANTEDGQLAQAVIDAFDYEDAKEILEV